jgi:methionyl-tRNA formyltransferase
MPTIRKLRGNWQCLIRVINHPNLSKTFKKHEDAKRWGNETELKIRREDAGIAKIKYPTFHEIGLKYIADVSITKKGFINIHASLLPKWRGAAPIQRSIMNLEKETGVSIMRIEKKLDTGPVCNSYKIIITDRDNTETISEKLSSLAAEKILDNIDDIFENKAEFKEQLHDKATYAKKIEKSEGKISWNESAKKIIGKINGLYPTPGAWFLYNNERYKILKAELSDANGNPGKILSENFEIGCGKNSIKVLEIQREAKKIQKINEFMLGTQIKKGSDLNYA